MRFGAFIYSKTILDFPLKIWGSHPFPSQIFLLSYTWVKGGNPFWVVNETASYNISTKNGLIRPHQGNLYNLRPCSFHIKSLSKKMTIKEGVVTSIPWRSFDFKSFLHAPKYSWLRDFLIFNVKICSVLNYKQRRQISQWQIIGSKQKYLFVSLQFKVLLHRK